jgi:hypothetical protein
MQILHADSQLPALILSLCEHMNAFAHGLDRLTGTFAWGY